MARLVSSAWKLQRVSSRRLLSPVARHSIYRSPAFVAPITAGVNARYFSFSLFKKSEDVPEEAASAAADATNTAAAAAVEIQKVPLSENIIDKLPNMEQLSEPVSAVSTAVCDHIGYCSEVGLANSWIWPSDFLVRSLEAVHLGLGIPWWGSIIFVTIAIRLCMVPFYLKAADASAKMSHIKGDMDFLNEQGKMYANDPDMSQKLVMKRLELFRSNKIKMRHMFAPLIQIPAAFGMYTALKRMSDLPIDGFASQGLLWFQDLAATDPYLGLQIVTAGSFIMFMKLGGETGAQQMNPMMKKVFTVLPLVSIPLTMYLPSSVVFYFFTNSIYSIFQTMMLKSHAVRNFFNLTSIKKPDPKKPVVSQSMKDMWETAKKDAEAKRLIKEKELEVKANRDKLKKSNNRLVSREEFEKNYKK